MNIRLYFKNGGVEVRQFNSLKQVNDSYESLGIAYHQVMLSPNDPLINEWNGKEWVNNGRWF